ncbi:MAG: two-component system sensor histidine kinase HydH [Desulforhopalus sp.]|jgi:two-component system sensor histidine kinase HydH
MMKTKSEKWRLKLLGFSPWILGSACILLLLVVAFFAVSNYEREKKLITNVLEQKGLTLVRFINSAAHDSVRSTMMRSSDYEQWETHIQPAMELAVEQPGVDSIVIVDNKGNILLSTGTDPLVQGVVDVELVSLIKELDTDAKPLLRTKIIKNNKKIEGKAVIATRYIPPSVFRNGQKNAHGRMAGWRLRHSDNFESFQSDMRRVDALAPIYLVQLDLSEVSAPLRRQFIQIVLELVAILLIGLGGTLSFFTLRGLKGSEKKLGRMREFNEVLVSSLPIGLIATDEKGAIQVINDAAESMTGLVPSDIRGRVPEDCMPDVLSEMLGQRVGSSSVFNNRISQSVELTLKEYTLGVNVVPVAGAKAGAGGEVMLLRDLTEVKHLEEELHRSERLAVIGKMAAGVAHELRNPMSSIKGLALLLKSKLGPENDGEETANTLVREVERLNRSIGELLDYAKPGSLHLESCSAKEIVEKTLLLLEPDLISYGVRVEQRIEEYLPKVSVDKDKISQVLLNILLNSLQAMEEMSGEKILKITLRHDGDGLVLSVSDNGCGIEVAHQKKIFDPYFTTKSSGTGLGLALSLKIVEEHGGKLFVSSVPGENTEFQLYLRCV